LAFGKKYNMATEAQIAEAKKELESKSTNEIRGLIPTFKPYAAMRIAGEIILEERKSRDDAANHPAKNWHEKGSGKFLIGVGIGLTVAMILVIIKIATGQ